MEIALANEKAREGIAALQHVVHVLGEAQKTLGTATHGTTQDEILQASGLLAQAAQSTTELQGTISASIETSESYAGRL